VKAHASCVAVANTVGGGDGTPVDLVALLSISQEEIVGEGLRA
jgi:hypothetical protein